MDANRPTKKKKQAGLLGLAFDAPEDDQKRITRGPNFVLAGGTKETHGVMQETAIKINEHLDRKGKNLSEVSTDELRAIVNTIQK
ncbi:MAG TPA: hypothetical protein DHW22_05740 [Planctomycetaceae bacterium]|nr:hypothetical protein [Planctomycetaceae bacterium]